MTPAQEEHETRRRHLLRLGTVAPMVLTLRPGASFAVSMKCSEKLAAVDQTRAEMAEKLATSANADEWVRAQVDIVQLHRIDFESQGLEDNRIEGKFVLGTDGTTYWRVDGNSGVGPLMASTKSTPRVSDGGGGVLGKDSPVGGEYNVSNATATPIEQRWALIRVDPQTGIPLGYSWEPQAVGGVMASIGCWASLHPGVSPTGTWAYIKGLVFSRT